MRKVFSSQRLENVEAVAQLLRDAGIEVKIENGRSYRGHRRGNFSYDTRKQAESMPAVWILRSEDQPRGRQMLRDMGLLESTRNPSESYVLASRHSEKDTRGSFTAKRIKLGLLVLIVAGIGLIAFGTQLPQLLKKKTVPAPPPAVAVKAPPAPLIPETITELASYQADVPTALAAALVRKALEEHQLKTACISVDGKAPSNNVMQAIANSNTALHPITACQDAATTRIDVSRYITDGSGSGEATLTVGNSAETLHVSREGHNWSIQGRR